MRSIHLDEGAREDLSVDLDEIARQGPAGCSPRLWRPRSKPTSKPPEAKGTKEDMPW